MTATAIVLAAGRGTRLGELPKAFIEIGGRSMLEHAIRAVIACEGIESCVVTAPPGMVERARALTEAFAKPVLVVEGGGSRQESVRRALDAVGEDADVLVPHDAARPFASPALFTRVLGALAAADGAIPGLPASDTVKRVEGGRIRETVAREGLVLVQTPQAFDREALQAAHAKAEVEGFVGTDDAELLERSGFEVALVPGEPENLKVTTPEDLRIARALAAFLKR
jgi:2-C-methyl-D-erythritol 4-phosphate cytidylyltransferase